MKSSTGKTVKFRDQELITCQKLITFLLDYLSQELTPEEERQFERHLAACPSCVAYLKTYKQALLLGRGALSQEIEAPPPELGDALVRAILQARG